MQIKRKLAAGIGVVAIIGAALWMRELASWRPVKMAVLGVLPELHVSADGKLVWVGEVGGEGQAYCLEPNSLDLTDAPPNYESFRLRKGIETFPNLIRRYDGTHFQMRNGAKIITVPRSWASAYSLARREIYIEQLDSKQGGGFISTWDMADGHLKRRVRYSRGNFSTHSAFSPDGKWLISAQAPSEEYSITVTPSDQETPSTLRRYDVQTGKVMAAPNFSSGGGIGRVKFSPDGKFFLVGPGLDNPFAIIYDASSWNELWSAKGILNADWLPGGQLGITNSQGLEWRDAATGKIEQTRSGPLTGTKFWTTSPDGKWIYASDAKGVIVRWRAR